MVKNQPAKQESQKMRVQSLDQEDPLEEVMVTYSSILARRIPWTGEPGALWSIGSQRVGHDWSNLTCMVAIPPRADSFLMSQSKVTAPCRGSYAAFRGCFFPALFSILPPSWGDCPVPHRSQSGWDLRLAMSLHPTKQWESRKHCICHLHSWYDWLILQWLSVRGHLQ